MLKIKTYKGHVEGTTIITESGDKIEVVFNKTEEISSPSYINVLHTSQGNFILGYLNTNNLNVEIKDTL